MIDEVLQRLARAASDPEARKKFHEETRRLGMAPKLVVRNIRHGFATNSSSSHSIILASGLEDDLATDSVFGFGWGNFVLASREAKSRYVAVMIAKHYGRYKLGPSEVATLVRRYLPDLPASTDEEILDGYIDHQSEPVLPAPRLSSQGMDPMWDLVRRAIIEDDSVAILGGNDNDDGHPLSGSGPSLGVYDDIALIEQYDSRRVYLKDATTGHFAIFDRKSGTKARLTYGNEPEPRFSTAPELVDVKVTDYCPVGCAHCYQDSTRQGKHAKKEDLHSLAYALGRAGTFEVALGGGDPTTHPDLAEILRGFHGEGVVPSFSTQLWDWLDDAKLCKVVAETCGAVALSTNNPAHVRPWLQKLKERGIRAHFHYVLGLQPLENLSKFLAAYGNEDVDGYDYGDGLGRANVVLLAYKEMGRAVGTPPVPYSGWPATVKASLSGDDDWRRAWTIAIDSFLVDDVKAGFSEDEVKPVLYEKSDGKFSCYYDAVAQQWAAHSFEPKERRIAGGPYQLAQAWSQISGAPVPARD